MTIQAVLIVKNEEAVLEKCLKSIKGIDTIVCDTGSSDKTVEIARKYGKVYEGYKWEDSFCKARNYALSKADNGWILIIDADEELITPVADVLKIIEQADRDGMDAIHVTVRSEKESFKSPRIFKNNGVIIWKGDAHNWLDGIKKQADSTIVIEFGYSPTHAKDPDRTLRILEKAVLDSGPREKFYLAREYSYKKRWDEAIRWCDEYLKVTTWAPEWAECYVLKAKCLKQLKRWDEARDELLKAIKINTNFREAIEMLAEMSGPINRRRWLSFAQEADNSNVLFFRYPNEKDDKYYDEIFKNDDMSRYDEIYKLAGSWCHGKTLDIGCGTGEMQKYVKDWHGFDFSHTAIEKADNPNAKVGNAYDRNSYGYFDTYLALEVMEHLDDYKVLANIPRGSDLVFSVPSFSDPGHLRTYTKEIVEIRYGKLMDIHQMVRFNWQGKWVQGGENTDSYILLISAKR